METIITMFASFVGFCGGVILITETVNKVFKVEGTTAKFIVSWVVAIIQDKLKFREYQFINIQIYQL